MQQTYNCALQNIALKIAEREVEKQMQQAVVNGCMICSSINSAILLCF